MDRIVIRSALPDDLAGLLALYRHLNPHDLAIDAAKARAAWSSLLGSGITTVFVAEEECELLASCVLAVIPNLTRGGRSFGVVENVVTHGAHRRRGLGRSVLVAALDAAWAAGCYKVMLASGRGEEVLRFYETVGFSRGGKTFFEIRRP